GLADRTEAAWTGSAVVAEALPEYDWDEILRHGRPGDLWITFGGFVYDVSKWADDHPGGADVLLSSHGRDATEAFAEAMHSDAAAAMAESFKIGRLRPGATLPADISAPAAAEPLEIPYAVRWLVLKGERFANFDVLNDNDTQLDY